MVTESPFSPPPRRPADLCSWQAILVGIVQRARAVEVARYEETGSAGLLRDLVPQTTILVLEAVDILEGILDHYDIDEEEQVSGAAELMASRQSAERIADLSFMARSELRLKLEVLAGLSAKVDSWQIVALCGSCLGKITKAMTAVDAALCAHEGYQEMLGYDNELTLSLEVRRAYGKFCRDLRDRESDSVAASLLGAATSIAKLIGREVYAHLRISDRVQIRALQERVIAWHRAPEKDLPAGLRLWQDIWGFAHLLLDVNKRQELVEHDRRTLDEIHLRLASNGAITHEMRRFLDELFGMDEELDILLHGDLPLDARSLAAPLRRLRSQHERVTATAESPDGEPESGQTPDLTLRHAVSGLHSRDPLIV